MTRWRYRSDGALGGSVIVSAPNVLWIRTDQQRSDSLGCNGDDFVETPTIDRLAASGVRFDRLSFQSPVWTPSRSHFHTGRYPRGTRVRQNGQPIPAEESLVTNRLTDAGWKTSRGSMSRRFPSGAEKT